MYTYHKRIVRYLIFRSDLTTFTNVNELSGPLGKHSFWALSTVLNLKTLCIFRLDAVQNIIKTEKNVNQMSGSSGKRNLLNKFSTILETVYVFRLDAVQKTIKVKNNVNEFSGSPGKHIFENNVRHGVEILLFTK